MPHLNLNRTQKTVAWAILYAALITIAILYFSQKHQYRSADRPSVILVPEGPFVPNPNLLANPFEREQPIENDFWLKLLNLDGTPAHGMPQPDTMFMISKFKPIVKKDERGLWRIYFAEPTQQKGKIK